MTVSMDVVFPDGTSNGVMQCIDVTIIDDSEIERNETFIVILTASSPAVNLGSAVATITITDTDGESIHTATPCTIIEHPETNL